jgi:hypothetical protein
MTDKKALEIAFTSVDELLLFVNNSSDALISKFQKFNVAYTGQLTPPTNENNKPFIIQVGNFFVYVYKRNNNIDCFNASRIN